MSTRTLHHFVFIVATLLSCAAAMPAKAASSDALQLLSITPAGNDVPPGQEIVLQFDRPMVALGNMARSAKTIPVHITPALSCEWRWLNSDELACRLPGQQHLRPATRYTIQVGTGLTALDDSHLNKPVTDTFTTERPRAVWTYFQSWQSPVMPVYLMHFNLPVTAAALEQHLRFVQQNGKGSVSARAQPFTKERTGSMLLPVPGVPGAVVFIEHPEPVKPEDAEKPEYMARKTWLIEPLRPLAPTAEYQLLLEPGLMTPLGPLPGSGGVSGEPQADIEVDTYGPFRLEGVICKSADGSDLHIKTGSPLSVSRCRPDSLKLEFSSPVPLATLQAAQWSPAPVTSDRLKQLWGNYSQWLLRPRWDAGSSPQDYSMPFGSRPCRAIQSLYLRVSRISSVARLKRRHP
ncbi:MAG: Ig-like domain-containing protein [Gammaproteobacteria bacterium]